jgi:hypothetical protein
MTTYIPFKPSNIQAPTYNVTLDNNPYILVVTWNVAAQRYYINIYSTDGTWIYTVPLTETAIGRPVESMYYDSNQQAIIGAFQALASTPQIGIAVWRPLGQIVQYTFAGFTPNALNGEINCLRTGFGTFMYSLASNPGSISVLGNGSRYMNMAGGYFQTSTLIYRQGQFEVNP